MLLILAMNRFDSIQAVSITHIPRMKSRMRSELSAILGEDYHQKFRKSKTQTFNYTRVLHMEQKDNLLAEVNDLMTLENTISIIQKFFLLALF